MNDYKSLKNAYVVKESFYPSSGCPAGKICPLPVENTTCKAGYYCVSSKFLPKMCESGFYCPENSKKPISCPYITPYSAIGSKSIEDCKEV